LIEIATKLIAGEKPHAISKSSFDLDYVGVKASQFSFTRLKGSDPVTGVEMSSTGEVACIGDDFNEAFLKSFLSTGYKIPQKAILLSTGTIEKKPEIIEELRELRNRGIKLYGTKGTARFYSTNGIEVMELSRPGEGTKPDIDQYLSNGEFDLVINIPKTSDKKELDNDYLIRRKAVDLNIPLITNIQIAKRFFKSLLIYSEEDLQIKSWSEYN